MVGCGVGGGAVGLAVGLAVGFGVGTSVGDGAGLVVGCDVGLAVGCSLGLSEIAPVALGDALLPLPAGAGDLLIRMNATITTTTSPAAMASQRRIPFIVSLAMKTSTASDYESRPRRRLNSRPAQPAAATGRRSRHPRVALSTSPGCEGTRASTAGRAFEQWWFRKDLLPIGPKRGPFGLGEGRAGRAEMPNRGWPTPS